MTEPRGLSESEVLARRARGLGNDVCLPTGRSYAQILRQNAFTFINSVLFGISVVLALLGRGNDALVTAGLVLLNVIVGMVQEGRAKRQLDRIALLTRPKATAVREGRERQVDPSEVVVGDVLLVRRGDQIVVDGQVVGSGRMEVDESLLTGESDVVSKRAGDTVYSGSFCVSGSVLYEAQKVGTESLANRISSGARAFRQVKTPLQREIDLVIRVLTVLALQMGILIGLSFALKYVPVVESIQAAAVIVALVPQGLVAMTTITYAVAAVRMAGKGLLIQRANAIESLSHVSVLCLDKTGTLTTNRIELAEVLSLSTDVEVLGRLLGDYVASASSGNATAAAIAKVYSGRARPLRSEVPFSSALRWSALAFADDERPGLYVLGAPETLSPDLHGDAHVGELVEKWTSRGLRVLLFAHAAEEVSLRAENRTADFPRDNEERPRLPAGLRPLGLLSFNDELRPEAQSVLSGFAQTGICLKIISGDNPSAVAALARQAGFAQEVCLVSGPELEGADGSALARAAEEATIFGRITPQQKERLVRALRQGGHYVAMIGDGVNDVLALKQAHLGIAMASGSQAARGVADVVLLNDSFASLPAAFREGQRIIKGMYDVMRLLLSRTAYVSLMILGAAVIGVPFPITPVHNSILALLTVGIPTLALTAWARPGGSERNLRGALVHFVMPAAFTVATVSLAVYLFYLLRTGDLNLARTALTTVTIFCGLVLIPFVEPPTPAWVAGDVLSGDWRPTILAVLMLLAYLAVLLYSPLRRFFELSPLPLPDIALLGAVVAIWAALLRWMWRERLFEHLLSAGDGR